MKFFRYKVIYSILIKHYEPSLKSRTSGFFSFKDEFDSKYLPVKIIDDYWLKFNREKDNEIRYVMFKEKDDEDYLLKLIIDYSESDSSSENQINLFTIQLDNSINIDLVKSEFNTSTNNPFHLRQNDENTNNNPIQLFLKKYNYIEINLLPEIYNNLLRNRVEELKDTISKYFLKYKQNYCFLTRKRHNNKGRLAKDSEDIIEHGKLDFDNIKDKIKTFCLKYILKKLNKELANIKNENLKNKLGQIKLFKLKQTGKRDVSNTYYESFINKTFKSIFRQKVSIQCKEENNNINLIDKIYKGKDEFKDIIDFLDMKYIYFFENLETHLKSDFSEIENKEIWEKLKLNLKKIDNKIGKNLDNNKILLSLKEDFRESINKYIEKQNEEYKEVFILSFEKFFKKFKPKKKYSEIITKENAQNLPKFKVTNF